MKELLTTVEVAVIAGITDARVRQLIYAKVLPAEKIGGRNLIRRTDLKLIQNRYDKRHDRGKREPVNK